MRAGPAAYLAAAGVTAVVDATHPFAARVTADAAEVCTATGVPVLILSRPAQKPGVDDTWLPARDPQHASRLVEKTFPAVVHVS